MAITVLKKRGPFELVSYNDVFYAVDYNNDSVGYSIIFTEDQEKAKKKYQEVTKYINEKEYSNE